MCAGTELEDPRTYLPRHAHVAPATFHGPLPRAPSTRRSCKVTLKRCTDTRHAHRVHRAPAHGDPASASSWQPQPPDRRARPNQRRVRSRGCARRAAACKRSAWGARAQTHAAAGVAPVSDAGQRSPRTHVPALAQAGWVTGAPTRRCAHRAHGCDSVTSQVHTSTVTAQHTTLRSCRGGGSETQFVRHNLVQRNSCVLTCVCVCPQQLRRSNCRHDSSDG